MKRTTLGHSDIEVSNLCLGSMSWGTKNTQAEAFAQIDRSLERGVDFIDTAEMYPTYPVKAETVGDSEVIIGNWFAQSKRRGDVVIATKVSGANGGFVRDGKGYDSTVIATTIESSLKRLQTDMIDLYQLHWPNRGSYHFRKYWDFDASGQDTAEVEAHMIDVLQAMGRAVEQGKIRAFGLSNESTWGTAKWLHLADKHGLPKPVSVQNEYSLLCRIADTDLAELCHHENVGLLPFTPMIAGVLGAEHGPDRIPEGSRRSREETLGGRINDNLWPATAAYRAVADKYGLDVHQMALAWTLTRPFVASSIFGASSDAQLETALEAGDLVLSDEVMGDIRDTYRKYPMPI